MKAKLDAALLAFVGGLHLLALRGVLGPEALASLYGRPFQEPDLEILMRHRAVLFGLLGAFLLYAAFKPAARPAAVVAGLISTASFIGLAWAVGGYNAAIGTVVLADVVAVACLLVVAVSRRPQPSA